MAWWSFRLIGDRCSNPFPGATGCGRRTSLLEPPREREGGRTALEGVLDAAVGQLHRHPDVALGAGVELADDLGRAEGAVGGDEVVDRVGRVERARRGVAAAEQAG